ITASARTPRLCATLKSPKLEAPLSMRPICKVCNSHDLKVAESVGSLQGGFKVVGEGFPSLTIRNVFCASISVSSSARRERLLQRFHHPNHRLVVRRRDVHTFSRLDHRAVDHVDLGQALLLDILQHRAPGR